MTMAPELYYDPYSYAIDDDPHPIWRRLRDEAPLYYNERLDFYALSRYADVRDASLDHVRFSSAKGSVLEMIQATDAGRPVQEIILFMDPPRHSAFRKLVSRGFTPRRIIGLAAPIRAMVTEMLDELVGRAGFDYVADFGAELPPRVVASLVGVPDEDHQKLREWTDAVLHIDDGATAQGSSAATATAGVELYAYFAEMAADRRARPRDDLVSALLETEVDLPDGTSRPLTDLELLHYIILIASAGTETVARFLGNAAVLLARHPDQRARLVDHPELITNAVEEILRYEAPSPIQARFLTRDVILHGQTVPAGARMALLTNAAGRDERHFPDPDRFDVGRDIENHLSFGWGIHFCVGAALAREEARAALQETLRRWPEWNIDEDRLERVRTGTVRGYARVPISF